MKFIATILGGGMNSILGGILVGFFFAGVGLVIVGMILDRKYKAMLSKRLLALKCRYNGYITMNFSFTLLFCIALEKHLDVAYGWLFLMDTVGPLPVIVGLVFFVSYFNQRDLLMIRFSRKENN